MLHALLTLFERQAGPVLEDFPEEAPATETQQGGFACPVSFAPAPLKPGELGRAMLEEIAQLSPWYDLAKKRRGRTTVGVFAATVDEAANHVVAYLENRPVAPSMPDWSAGMAVKRACDDIKAYYYEAAAAQPGNLASLAIENWFWRETAAARALLAMRDICLNSDDPSLKPLGKQSLIPRAVAEQH